MIVNGGNKINIKLINFSEIDKFAVQSYCAVHNIDEEKNIGDITKINKSELDDFNFICGGSPCFKAGTQITTDKGLKNIEDIKVGDRVLTHTNTFQEVLRTGSQCSKEIYKLKIQGSPITYATGNHPYYVVERTWKHFTKVIDGKKRRVTKGFFSEPKWKSVEQLTKNDLVMIGKNIENENIYSLTNEECWLIGRWIADGYIRDSKRPNRKNSYNYQITFCIGKHKLDEFKSNVSEYSFSVVEKRTVYKCRIFNKRLMNLCLKCGKGAANKVVPQFILNLPQDKLEIFLNGYMSGDGCFTNNSYKVTSVSKKLIYQLGQVISKLDNYGCYSIHYVKRELKCVIEGREVNQKDTWTIVFNKKLKKQSNGIRIGGQLFQPFKKKELIEDYNDLVYNLEVDVDHSYVSNNCVTKNCQDFSLAGQGKGAIWTCEDCKHEYNPLAVHYTHRGECPICNSKNIEKTRSSLLIWWLDVIRTKKPNFGIYENVKNLAHKFKETFKMFEDELNEYGYNTYWKILNAKNFGIPQNRERIYLILIKKELDNGKFVFPEGFNNPYKLKNLLEDESGVAENFYLSDERLAKARINVDKIGKNFIDIVGNLRGGGQKSHIHTQDGGVGTLTATGYKQPKQILSNEGTNKIVQVANIAEEKNFKNPQRGRVYSNEGVPPTLNTAQVPQVIVPEKTKKGYKEAEYGDCIYVDRPWQKRGCVQKGQTQTIKTSGKDIAVVLKKGDVRYLTPKECWRLMGFSDIDYENAVNVGISNSQLYKQAGNSIVVDVLYYIFLELYRVMPYLFEDVKIGSFFSGIGAFETALKRLKGKVDFNIELMRNWQQESK